MPEPLELYEILAEIAKKEYSDITKNTQLIRKRSPGSAKLRIHLKEESFIDIWLSPKGKYSYHWERRAKSGEILRHDNAPDFPEISTYPKHFHNGNEQKVKESALSERPEKALRQFLDFVKQKLHS